MSSSPERDFYVTTPIYYINDAPHMGHAYTTVVCDAFARYHRLRGRETRFLTGTDEHGKKAATSAEKQGITPQQLADNNVARYRAAWEALGIQNDDFIRTTEDRHRKGAQAFWTRLARAGDIYKSSYTGPYCIGCETYYTESQLADGKCPEAPHHEIEQLSEDSYFFKLSRYQDRLLELYHQNPEFVTPKSRLNEVMRFVEGGLDDLSVSRTKFDWGVPVPGDPEHVMFVWIEALSNYITALGYGSGDEELFHRLWPSEMQVVGKDILRFHAVYWPAFLMSAGLEPPQQIVAHGWWNKDGEKMSKTKGNVANPFDLVEWFGRDPLRWFLLKEIALGSDGNYSEEALIDRTNVDLANDLGNTLSRVTKIVSANLGGRVPASPHAEGLAGVARAAWHGWAEGFEDGKPQAALRATWELLDATNKFLVAQEPWKLAKDQASRPQLESVMHDAAEALRQVALMILPAIPDSAAKVFAALGLGEPPTELPFDPEGETPWGFPQDGGEVTHGQALFPRIDKKGFFAELAKAADRPKQKAKPKQKKPKQQQEKKAVSETATDDGLITIDDVMKVQLRTAVVKSAKKHPDADKLIVLELDDGSGEPRTICAGVAAFYAPEDLEGKTVVVVANLKPRKLRGVPSQGMLLAANYGEGDDETVRVITLPDGTPPGAEVR